MQFTAIDPEQDHRGAEGWDGKEGERCEERGSRPWPSVRGWR